MYTLNRAIEIAAAVGMVSSWLYYALCLWGAIDFLGRGRLELSRPQFLPAISILKPLKGVDPEIYENFRSHCLQDYPEYEIIFGVSEADDPAIQYVERLRREFPTHSIRLIVCPKILGPNIKVSNLAQMLNYARFDHLIVNDSDIRVAPDYLRKAIAPLANSMTGLSTSLYRAIPASTLGSRLESLGVGADFAPGVLAARQLEGGIRFGLGSTLALRRSDLNRIGGFEDLLDYLADDYELGKRIASSGLAVKVSDAIVETFLPPYRFRDFLAHQLRWARGIRDARRGGYFGLIFTFGIFWSLTVLAASRGAHWSVAAFVLTLAIRLLVAFAVGGSILRDPAIRSFFWLIPLRDLIAVCVWIAGLFGHSVIWRGKKFGLQDGKLRWRERPL